MQANQHCKNIPVIFFDFGHQRWEAVDKEDEQARAAAKYRNQLDELEVAKLSDVTLREHKPRENNKKARNRKMPSGFSLILLLAAIFYALWMMHQR